MGNENERKRNPSESRKELTGYGDEHVKTGGDEQTVGIANDPGFGKGGGPTSNSVGSVGIIGGSAGFLTEGEDTSGEGTTAEAADKPERGSD